MSLKKVDDPSELSAAVKESYHIGSITNIPLDTGKFMPEILLGNVMMEKHGNNLFVLKKTEYVNKLYFIKNDFEDLSLDIPEKTVTEYSYKTRDSVKDFESLKRLSDRLEKLAMTEVLSRKRFSLKCGGEEHTVAVNDAVSFRIAGTSDSALVLTTLTDNFDVQTGCIPSRDEMNAALEAGNIIFAEVDGKTAGLIHLEGNDRSAEIRHLCVNDEFRNKGIAETLVGHFISFFKGSIVRVWTGENNTAAIRTYSRFGFTEDGMKSVVFLKNSEVKNMDDKLEKLVAILHDEVPGVDFMKEKNLVDDEILTSLDIIGIVTSISLNFNIDLDVDDIVPENFNSIDDMLEMINRKLG